MPEKNLELKIVVKNDAADLFQLDQKLGYLQTEFSSVVPPHVYDINPLTGQLCFPTTELNNLRSNILVSTKVSSQKEALDKIRILSLYCDLNFIEASLQLSYFIEGAQK
jgi:hypothetical protein